MMKPRPLIGISAAEVRTAKTIRRVKEDEPLGREYVIGDNYIQAIVQAAGMPVVIPVLAIECIDELLDERVDGICIPGGPDLDPVHYGAEPDPNLGPTDMAFDAFQLALIERAVARHTPLLAICRGMQVLNVAVGGTLLQHLPDHSPLSHRQDDPGHIAGHSIQVEPTSRLADLIGLSTLEVNTYHHQAVESLGRNLRVTARAPDGVVEAVEGEGPGFLVGLQWHAELMAPRKVEALIFAGLVDAAAQAAEQKLSADSSR